MTESFSFPSEGVTALPMPGKVLLLLIVSYTPKECKRSEHAGAEQQAQHERNYFLRRFFHLPFSFRVHFMDRYCKLFVQLKHNLFSEFINTENTINEKIPKRESLSNAFFLLGTE